MLLTVAPSGGQRIARRNALAAVRRNDIAALERAEATAALVLATAPTARPAAS
jgi:hypothetical protein